MPFAENATKSIFSSELDYIGFVRTEILSGLYEGERSPSSSDGMCIVEIART